MALKRGSFTEQPVIRVPRGDQTEDCSLLLYNGGV